MSSRTVVSSHLPALLWSLVVLVLLLVPGDDLPVTTVWDWLDKPAHALLFAVHCGLLERSFEASRRRRAPLGMAVAGTGIYAVLLEAAQIAVPGRGWEWWDIAADLAGIALAALFLARRRATLRGAS